MTPYPSNNETDNPDTEQQPSENKTTEDSSTEGSQTTSSESPAKDAGAAGPPKPKKRKILIGSQLGDDENQTVAANTEAKVVIGATINSDKIDSAVNVSSSSAETTDELQSLETGTEQGANTEQDVEKQLDEIMSGVSMDQLMADESVIEELEMDSRIKATVQRVHNENIFFNLKGRFEGVASVKNFKSPPEPGTMMDVLVKGYNSQDGLYEVVIPGVSVDVEDWSDLTQGSVVEVKVTGSNTGGLECSINNIRGFIPASQIEIYRVDNFGDYVNRKLQCVVQEVNPKRKKLVLSHRAIAEREKEEKKKELLSTIQTGETREGTVTKLMDFGAFVDIGGVEGLVHISKLSWERVDHPKEVVKAGEKVTVKIEKVNQQSGKIALSLRDTQEHPWKRVDEKYPVNSTAKGTVSRLAQFGAFVKLEPGIEGLVHISEIAHHRVVAVSTHLKVGDEVETKVVSVDPEAQKIGLSIKALLAKPEKPEGEKTKEEVDEPIRETAVKPTSNEPLKGGTQKKTGGESFGLNW